MLDSILSRGSQAPDSVRDSLKKALDEEEEVVLLLLTSPASSRSRGEIRTPGVSTYERMAATLYFIFLKMPMVLTCFKGTPRHAHSLTCPYKHICLSVCLFQSSPSLVPTDGMYTTVLSPSNCMYGWSVIFRTNFPSMASMNGTDFSTCDASPSEDAHTEHAQKHTHTKKTLNASLKAIQYAKALQSSSHSSTSPCPHCLVPIVPSGL